MSDGHNVSIKHLCRGTWDAGHAFGTGREKAHWVRQDETKSNVCTSIEERAINVVAVKCDDAPRVRGTIPPTEHYRFQYNTNVCLLHPISRKTSPYKLPSTAVLLLLPC